MSYKSNTKDFIIKSKKIHGNKYDYSLVKYINAKSKIKIICKRHGCFEQTPNKHLNGRDCKYCGNEKKGSKITKTTKECVEEFKNIHKDKYDYSLVEYNGTLKPIKIICPEHGVFEQKPREHLRGKGCKKCYLKRKPIGVKIFITRARKLHGDKYDYSYVKYDTIKHKVKIICPKHGEFNQIAEEHLNGAGCPKCNCSKGETIINNFLMDKNVKFIHQKRFNDCKNVRTLPFDFYLPNENILIEYDGRQHFEPVKAFGGEKCFNKLKINDKIKNKYAKENNIKLIRIPYFESIKKILNNILL